MQVGLLGPLQVQVAGRSVPLGGGRQQAVLAMLALQVNQVVSVDRLVDGLWGEAAPDGAVNAVQAYLSRLRRRLQEAGQGGVVVRHRPGYLLALDADQVDWCRFERLAGQRLQRVSRTARDPVRLRRAMVALASAQGWPAPDIADLAQVSQRYVRQVIHDFNERRFAVLDPKWSGARRGRSMTRPVPGSVSSPRPAPVT